MNLQGKARHMHLHEKLGMCRKKFGIRKDMRRICKKMFGLCLKKLGFVFQENLESV